jgi:hypothetical protein
MRDEKFIAFLFFFRHSNLIESDALAAIESLPMKARDYSPTQMVLRPKRWYPQGMTYDPCLTYADVKEPAGFSMTGHHQPTSAETESDRLPVVPPEDLDFTILEDDVRERLLHAHRRIPEFYSSYLSQIHFYCTTLRAQPLGLTWSHLSYIFRVPKWKIVELFAESDRPEVRDWAWLVNHGYAAKFRNE